MQAELRDVGIALSLRSTEFGTFYSDITKGAFQMYLLRWIGSNEDPDIFHYSYSTDSFPPKGANRGHYANLRVDALVASGEHRERRLLSPSGLTSRFSKSSLPIFRRFRSGIPTTSSSTTRD
jgi:ABC-type oligopeptide transport system substrate-binding subunit